MGIRNMPECGYEILCALLLFIALGSFASTRTAEHLQSGLHAYIHERRARLRERGTASDCRQQRRRMCARLATTFLLLHLPLVYLFI